jgi:transcription antitermination factor NusG
VVKTKPRAEKKLAQQLAARGMRCYAITYTTMRQWSDRKKKVALPLIPGVVFLEHHVNNLSALYQYALVQGVLKEFGQPALVKTHEIDNLLLLAKAWSGDAVPTDRVGPHLCEGDWVEVTHGQFKGLRGTLTELKGQHRLVVTLDALQWAVTLDISKSQVKKLHHSAA